ncbi:MAG TPA: CdaR family protein [Blastocatellia bacterium]|nr:CdaR family protein [Blastocatellia bacterium]
MDRMLHYLKVLKEYATDYILENTGLKILALFITAVLWISVAMRPVSQITLRDVPIELRLPPESSKLVVSRNDGLSAQVYLSGPRDVLDTRRSSELTVIADLSDAEPGVRVIPLGLDRSRLPASVSEQGVEPRSIRVTVERELEREVPVVARFDGEPPPGYEVISKQIVPLAVRIVGPASQVKDIEEVSTETISLSDKTESFSMMAKVYVGSPSDLATSNVDIKDYREVLLTVNIGEVKGERAFERIPITVVNGPAGVAPVPRFVIVTLSGAKSAIEQIRPEDISAIVDLQSQPEKPREYTPRIEIASGYSDRVSVKSFEPRTIRVR